MVMFHYAHRQIVMKIKHVREAKQREMNIDESAVGYLPVRSDPYRSIPIAAW